MMTLDKADALKQLMENALYYEYTQAADPMGVRVYLASSIYRIR
jgi:hypothetical protein